VKRRIDFSESDISTGERLLLIVFCERESGGVIRLISARKATAKEAKTYEEGI
jgi:uncharacterized DUF497 family protein